mgnify:CR=1 FL=1
MLFRTHLQAAGIYLSAGDLEGAIDALQAAKKRAGNIPSRDTRKRAQKLVDRAIVLTRAATLVRSIQEVPR